jgi:hypothetical protein
MWVGERGPIVDRETSEAVIKNESEYGGVDLAKRAGSGKNYLDFPTGEDCYYLQVPNWDSRRKKSVQSSVVMTENLGGSAGGNRNRLRSRNRNVGSHA